VLSCKGKHCHLCLADLIQLLAIRMPQRQMVSAPCQQGAHLLQALLNAFLRTCMKIHQFHGQLADGELPLDNCTLLHIAYMSLFLLAFLKDFHICRTACMGG
jgi:hypothetical protein